MKKLLLTMTAISALAIAAPAAAQSRSDARGDAGFDQRIERLQTRIQAGVQQGAITRAEAQPLRQRLRQLTRLERQYSRNGLTQQERADLRMRIRDLRQQIRVADRGVYDRYEQRGEWADYDQDYGNNYDGRGGPYEQPCEASGGITGIIANLFGADQDCAGLRVGQRVSGNLYGVPDQYRNQFRDGNGAYFRSDGRAIYQIDARTHTVVRVYPMNR